MLALFFYSGQSDHGGYFSLHFSSCGRTKISVCVGVMFMSLPICSWSINYFDNLAKKLNECGSLQKQKYARKINV